MKISRMALRGLLSRGWVSALTLTSLTLAVALPCAILGVRQQVETSLLQEGREIDLVAGAKGSPLQLVLSTVHHLDVPTGNIPWRMVEKFRKDKRVTALLPIGLGDNFQGYRIVGTDNSIQTWQRKGDHPYAPLESGEWFDKAFDAVIGSEVAQQSGLTIGDKFVGAHGLVAAPGTDHAEFPYTVTGRLAPTGTAVDRLIFTPMQSVWDVHASEQNFHNKLFGSGETASNTETEVTAIWLKLRSPGLRMWLREEINDHTEIMAAAPMDELLRLAQGVLKPLQEGLLIMAAAVVVVSALAMLSTLLQAADRRRRDWALLRILGARPREVFSLVWLEALWLTEGGLFLGLLLAHGGLAALSRSGITPVLNGFNPWQLAPGELGVLLTVFGFGALAGLIPATIAYLRSPLQEIL
ncbi:ABC transporter permease [Kiritimatiellaeota bacterium B1221]|nr:ABC transporter permease [Kiritimatiellaeota bacterium B1221]